MQKGLKDSLAAIKPSASLMQAFANDKQGIEKVGTTLGTAVSKQMTAAIVDGMGDTNSAIVKAIYSLGDGRYMRQPLVQGAPQ